MSTKIAAHVALGVTWAFTTFSLGNISETWAQVQGQNATDPKPDVAPAVPASTNAPRESTEPRASGSAAADRENNEQPQAGEKGTAAAAVAGTNAAPAQPATDAGGTEVSSGSGLFEQAQSSTPAPEAEASESNAKTSGVDLDGYVRGDMYVGQVPGANNGDIKAGYGELGLKFRLHKDQYGDAFAELRLRDGIQGDSKGVVFDVREAYVNGYFGPFDLRFGKQIIVWGRADAFNPTNNITPNDLRVRSPVEDDRRVGNVGARGFLNFAPFRLEGIWMPLYVASELPTYQLPQFVYFGDTRYPPPHLDRGLGAGRLHLELSSIEMSASFVHGYAPLPGLTLQSYTWGVTPTTVLISRTAYDQNVAGFDFSTAIGELLGVRGEIAYRRPIDYRNRPYTPKPDLQYVLGLDHTFGSVSVIAQYLGRYVFDWRKELGPDPNLPYNIDALAGFTTMTPVLEQGIRDAVSSTLAQKNQILFGQTERVQHLASLRVEWLTLNETLSLSALGLANFSTREWLAYPKLAYKVTDRMSTAIGAEIYWGPENTLFGMIKQSLSAGYAELRYTF